MKYFKITPETTEESIKARYRELAKLHHPDAGGLKEDFQQLKAEYEAALFELKKQGEYVLLADSEIFHDFLSGADALLVKNGYPTLGEILSDNAGKIAGKIIDSIKIPLPDEIKMVIKTNLAIKVSNPAKFAAVVEKYVRETAKKKNT